MERFAAAVGYDRPLLDFAERLADVEGVVVSAKGPRRRVRLTATREALERARKALPGYVILEPEERYTHTAAS